jgi:hypothetical protein
MEAQPPSSSNAAQVQEPLATKKKKKGGAKKQAERIAKANQSDASEACKAKAAQDRWLRAGNASKKRKRKEIWHNTPSKVKAKAPAPQVLSPVAPQGPPPFKGPPPVKVVPLSSMLVERAGFPPCKVIPWKGPPPVPQGPPPVPPTSLVPTQPPVPPPPKMVPTPPPGPPPPKRRPRHLEPTTKAKPEPIFPNFDVTNAPWRLQPLEMRHGVWRDAGSDSDDTMC